jgi:A/G-specific adenine glycosylase
VKSAGRIGGRHLAALGTEAGQVLARGDLALHEFESHDGGASEISIDSFAKLARLMLQEHRGAWLCLDGEDAAGGAFAQAQRTGEAGDFRPDDLRPARDEGGIAEACALESRGGDGVGAAADSLGPVAPRNHAGMFFRFALRHGHSFRLIRIMPKAARATQRKIDPAARLLAWYDANRRVLPWRAKPGETADPYRVWLSEIMLQQTTVVAVASYYREFLRRWPTVKALADAPLDEVLGAWAGLGYYARARNLHRAAKTVANELRGKFPQTAEGLRALPGIGPYTAGAISAIAFDAREAAIDANGERVLARYFAVEEPLPGAKPKLRALGQSLVPEKRAGDFAQALMDLGALICSPKKPACPNCPWAGDCVAYAKGIAEKLPLKGAKPVRPLKRGAAFVVRDAKGAVLLVKRPENGLLGAMLQPPLGPWAEEFPSQKVALSQAPFDAAWRKRAGLVRHGFTHFELEIEVYAVEVAKRPKAEGKWIAESELRGAALPTVMRKIVAHALDEGGPLFSQIRPLRKT